MSDPGSRTPGVDDKIAKALTARLFSDVGAFFSNTRRSAPSICQVCTGPANDQGARDLCSPCRSARKTHGRDLADLVVPLTYAKGLMPSMHQSAHHVLNYKETPPAPGCLQDLRLLAGAGAYLHGRCIAATVGWWQAVTFVPSAKRPGTVHPVAHLARVVHDVRPSATKLVLDVGPDIDSPPARMPRQDRFSVPVDYRAQVADRHVLVVDDTWVSGNKSQSATLALKAAGAARVTIFCTSRWLRNDWDDHRSLIEKLVEPYDAMRCPVTGDVCP
jgi:phosphoribosylpyrophosphate synthetase